MSHSSIGEHGSVDEEGGEETLLRLGCLSFLLEPELVLSQGNLL